VRLKWSLVALSLGSICPREVPEFVRHVTL
jgi:hypothetical protein